jgi:YHS domain-containing protein
MKFNRAKLGLFFIIGVGIAAAVWAVSMNHAEGVKPVNAETNNLAVRGFDTVAFFTDKKLTRGKAEFVYDWLGAKWQFSSAENLDLFKQNPEKYAPQFGGYCSYAVSHGYTADADPGTWKIVDGKLYLNYNHEVKKMWEQNQQQFIKDGEKNWAEFQKKKPEHKG